MAKISPDLVRSLITQDGTLFIPKAISAAIASCVVSDADAVREEGNRLKTIYESFEKRLEPMVVDYSGDARLDAYTIYYLPRNSLVPKIAIQGCAYSTALQELPNRLKVLDIGSGTGAVVLGLLDLFSGQALSRTRLDIVALDASPEALRRQSQLVRHLGLRGSSLQSHCVDLSSPRTYEDKLAMGTPYDMVFAANVITELDEQGIDALLERVAPLVSDNGILTSVEAQRNYTMAQRARIAKNANDLGLFIYYPCPPSVPCTRTSCWKWRTDKFQCGDIAVGSEVIEPTKIQIASWMILSKKSCSIYEMLHDRNPDLVWGVAAAYKPEIEGDKVRHGYEFCTEAGWRTGTATMALKDWVWRMGEELFKRGTIVGITKNLDQIKEGWDIVSGFVEY